MLATTAGLALLAGCTAGNDGDEPAATSDTAPSEVETTEEAPSCELAAEVVADAAEGPNGAVTAGIDCAEQVVVVPAGDPTLAAIAVPLAVSLDAPLLLGDETELADVLGDLGDPEVRTLAATEQSGGGENESDDESAGGASQVAIEVADELGVDRFVAAPEDRPGKLTGAAVLAARSGAAVLPVPVEGSPPTLPPDAEVVTLGDLGDAFPDATPADETAEGGSDEAPSDSWGEADAPLAWLVAPTDPAALPAAAVAALRDDAVVPVPGRDLLARGIVERVRDADLDHDRLVAVGDVATEADADRHLTLLADAPLLPGGTLRHFDGTRMVAMYGKPGTSALGVLGEQDLDASLERVRDIAEGYDADGRVVVPTFEVIVTVASAEAGDDGQYSRVTPPEEYRELVDRAGEEGVQVILDLQPGRNSFVEQAQIYEDLLREPHVGLALDPEWRLEDDQVHLQQIGSVDAAEVQEVVDWYAGLARDTGVAEKLLVLHQFRVDMLPDRDTIEAPPEVAVAVHADGQGPQGMKLETWRVLTRGAEDRWHWGWKNFYDEDPVVAEPSYVLDLDPEVVLVTYQ